MKSRSMIAAGVLLGWWSCAYALDASLDINQYAHIAWRNQEGFANGPIHSLAQTADGYLWIGTERELLRFDGIRTAPWRPPEGKSLSDSTIRCLLGARDGTLWIGTLKGLANWKSDKLKWFPQLEGWMVNAVLEDRAGIIWAVAMSLASGRGKLCAMRKSAVECEGDDGRFPDGLTSLHEDSKGDLWASGRSLWRSEPGGAKPQPLPEPAAPGLQALADGEGGALLIATGHGITRLVDETHALPFAALPERPRTLLRDRNGALWIGTARGLLHMHGGRMDAFGKSDGLSGEGINNIFEDREGNIWVATEGGVDRFRDVAVATYSVERGLSGPSVASLLASRDGSLWISALGGLNRWNKGEMTVYARRHSDPAERALSWSTRASAIREIRDSGLPEGPGPLFEDDRGRIWIGLISAGVGYLENDRYVAIDGTGTSGGYVNAITEDTTGNVWIAHHDLGLVRVSAGHKVQQIPWNELSSQNEATRLVADHKNGGLWLGFLLGGVAHFVDGRIRASYSAADGLAEGRVYDLVVDPDGTLWAAAEGGLSRLKNGRIATLDSRSGLPCDPVDWLIDDNSGAVWVYTACGLARIPRAELENWAAAPDQGNDVQRKVRATVFDQSQGFRSATNVSSYSPHVAKSPDGRLWFATAGGVGVVDPSHLPYNVLPPPVHIEQVIADRTPYEASLPLHLPPLVRDLQVNYTALSYVAPEKMLFRYKLEGHDQNWLDAGNRRQAFYNDLAPGTYRFRVVASNNSGLWNEQGDSLAFSIAPAYWQTAWFRALCAAAFLALVWLLYVLRLRQVRRAFNMTVETRVAERTRIARDLHDSLLQGFQGLMFRLQAVRQLLPERPSDAAKILDSALQVGDQAIGAGRDAVQNLRSSPLDERDLATSLSALGAELELGIDLVSKPEYRVIVEGSPRELTTAVRDDVYRIAREAVRNAYQHAKAGHIETEVTFGDVDLTIRVRDDGIGIDPQILGRGQRAGHFGLPGMRERSESVGGRLRVWSEGNAGTEVELRIPAKIAYVRSPASTTSWIRRLFYSAGRSPTNAERHRGAD